MAIGVDGVGDEVAERLPGELVGDVEDLDGPPEAGHVELVVEGPDVVGVGRLTAGRPGSWRSRGVGACGACGGTRRPSSRHRRWTFLRLSAWPSRASTAWARR